MKLLTKEIEKSLPELGKQDGLGHEAIAYVKFFTPDANYTWYATEYDPKEREFFGLVDGQYRELGYFFLDELLTARGMLGLPVERDIHFKPTKLSELA